MLHDPEARGAGLRDLARGRRGLAAGRRELLDHAQLDNRPEPPVYWTGNPCPDFDGGVREGDNLSPIRFAVTPTAARSGALPVHPARPVDYDSVMEHLLFDLDGQNLAAHFDKTDSLHPGPHDLDTVRVVPFVDRIDGERSREGQRDAEGLPRQGGDPLHFWPGPAGAKSGRTRATARIPSPLRPGAGRGATATRRRGSSRRASRIGAPASPWTPTTSPVRERLRPAYGPGALALEQRPVHVLVAAGTGGGLVFGGEPSGEFNA